MERGCGVCGMVGGLEERSRAPHRIPHKTSKAEEEAIVQARKKAPCYGPRRLKREFGLKAGKNAIGRILKERELGGGSGRSVRSSGISCPGAFRIVRRNQRRLCLEDRRCADCPNGGTGRSS